jgi:hypothetical protein
MKFFAIIIIISSFLHCSDKDHNPVLAKRDRTLLENKVLGTWQWTAPTDRDQVEFKEDLTFSGEMNGARYAGTFLIAGDSVMKLERDITINRSPSVEYFQYRVRSVDDERLVLLSSYQNLTYLKIR